MFGISTTTMSSKGQIVIPAEVRQGIREGDRFVIIRKGKNFLLKPADAAETNFTEDLIVAERVEQAWKRYEQGKFKKATKEEFLEILKKL